MSEALRDALEMAKTGLLWYQDRYPEIVDGSDDEAMTQIDAALAQPQAPIDMVLHCPVCHTQHIDTPKPRHIVGTGNGYDVPDIWAPEWTNPPHRSHLCHSCGHIWRPADVPTNGVAAVLTKGKVDSPITNRKNP